MTAVPGIQDDVPVETATTLPGGAASLESIVRTEQLLKRPARPPDYESETSALAALVRALADSPQTILQALADRVLAILGADSAGLSLLTKDAKRFYWAAIAGAWAPHLGGGTPRDFGPCGDVLDRNVPMLFTHWERRYPYLGQAVPLAEEGLLVPFYVSGRAVGTLWAIAHSTCRHFDVEDLRLLQSMGRFASAAYQAVQAIDNMKSEIATREMAQIELRALTDRLEAEVRSRTQDLEHSEANLAEAQTLSHTGSWHLNLATGEARWSRELYAILRLRPETTDTRSLFLDRIHPEDRLRVARVRAAAFAQRKDFDMEYRLLLPAGEIRYVHARGHCLPGNSKEIEYVGALMDITERKQAEENLRRSEAFLAEGQKLSRIGSFSWRVVADQMTWSEQLYRIFGFETGVPVTLELIRTRVHPDDVALLDDMIDRARTEGGDLECEPRLRMPDGSVSHLHLIAHGSRDQDDRLEYIGAIQDVTERRMSEEAVGKARSDLAHAARVMSLGALTASIAHEVNQPLAGIATNASTCIRMLNTDPPDVDGARETARRAIRDANRASEVITRLRALFAKSSASSESVDLSEAAREVVALSLSELQRGEVVLRTELANDLPPVTGDRVQLQQVILNLLMNAADALSGVRDRPRQIVIRTERDEADGVRVSVRDTGVGFDPQIAQKLFEAFYTTKSGGMGIGLSISRSIIESHRGRLWATPNDGAGATFSFSIPFHEGYRSPPFRVRER